MSTNKPNVKRFVPLKPQYNQGDIVRYRPDNPTSIAEPQLLVIVEVLATRYKTYWFRKSAIGHYSHEYFDGRSAFSLVVRGQ